MADFFKKFYYEEDGMGTIEIVIIIAVLVALALVFRNAIGTFAKNLMEKFFQTENIDTTLEEPDVS